MDDQQLSSLEAGLYVVATPIGNLADISLRALDVLRRADRVAAEDTRVSRRLLEHHGIPARLESFHAHNENQRSGQLLEWLRAGESVALISDAGTPLISDPGYPLIRQAVEAGIRVVPVPGPCALVAALAVSGLPASAFCFEGFLPARTTERRKSLAALAGETRTLLFYESSHRIVDSLADCCAVLGAERPAVVARELTKRFETVLRGSLQELADRVRGDRDQQRGEFVLLIAGASEVQAVDDAEAERLLGCLLDELPASKAAHVAARYLGRHRRDMYALAMQLAGG